MTKTHIDHQKGERERIQILIFEFKTIKDFLNKENQNTPTRKGKTRDMGSQILKKKKKKTNLGNILQVLAHKPSVEECEAFVFLLYGICKVTILLGK